MSNVQSGGSPDSGGGTADEGGGDAAEKVASTFGSRALFTMGSHISNPAQYLSQ